MPKTQAADIFAQIPHARSVTIRHVLGDGDQIELQIGLRRGDITIRLVADPGRAIRITNLRGRDKRLTPKLSVPFLNGKES
jgi:hypothetical protein